MNVPEMFFAFRKVYFESRWHLRCIDCSSNSEKTRSRKESWSRRLSGAEEDIVFSLPPGRCETTHELAGPAVVYGDEPTVHLFDTPDQIHANVAQNWEVVVTDHDLTNVKLPSFLADQPTIAKPIDATICFASPFLKDLPDVRAFDKRMLENSADSDDLLLLGHKEDPLKMPTRIPLGLLLPATLETGGMTIPVIYQVREWLSEHQAAVRCFVSHDADITKNSKLIRTISDKLSRTTTLLGLFV